MSDLGFAFTRPAFKLRDALTERRGFMPDLRFDTTIRQTSPDPAPPTGEPPEEDAPDPLAEAYTQGYRAGFEQAEKAAREREAAEGAAREALTLALTRCDAELEEQLRLRLRETVAALCESAIAPLALDGEALDRRIRKAVSMLARADDERVIHLHPQDMTLVSPRLAEQWNVQPDAKLARGTIRIETANGGIEDGPATWRQAIADALDDG